MKTILHHIKKHTTHVAKHLHKHKHRYALGTFGTFAVVKMLVLLVGAIGIFQLGDIFAQEVVELNSGNIVTSYGCATDATSCDLSNLGITSIATNTFINHTGLLILYLGDNSITSLESRDFYGLDSLTELYLNSNLITSLESGDFVGLSSLTQLNLSYNKIISLESVDFTGLSALTTLNLGGNQINSIESGDFDSLTELINLYLNNNLITSIESGGFAGLTGLITLFLGSNQISSIESGGFAGLTGLITLFLGSNQISSIESGDFAGLSSLTQLYLNSNQLTSIENSDFADLNNLINLNLQSNQISSIESGGFAGLDSLTTLDLGYNQLNSIESGSFVGLTNLSNLYLYNNLLSTLPDSIMELTTISSIWLEYNCWDIESMSTGLITFLDNIDSSANNWQTSENPSCPVPTFCSTITDVSEAECEALSGFYYSTNGAGWTNDTNWLSGTTVEDWYGVTVSGNYIYSINLNSNNLIGTADMSLLSNIYTIDLHTNQLTSVVVSGLTSLNALDLRGNRINSIEEGDFAGLDSLTTFEFSDNHISSIESGDFVGLSNLNVLYFNGNYINSIEIGDFAGLSSLTHLTLDRNGITLIENNSFADLASLDYLDLTYNQITSIESGSFTGLDSLTILYLHNNQITSIENGDFAGLSSLTLLGLGNNQITSIERDDFVGNPTLTHLYLNGNGITLIESGTFADLTNLNWLYLDNNQITSIGTNSFTGLDSLIGLYLEGNCIDPDLLSVDVTNFLNTPGFNWSSQYVCLDIEYTPYVSNPVYVTGTLVFTGGLSGDRDILAVANPILPSYVWTENVSYGFDISSISDPSNLLRTTINSQTLLTGEVTRITCGDGSIDTGETCDDGINNGTYGYCNATCTALQESICGNEIIEGSETCDDGINNGTYGYCNATCNGETYFCETVTDISEAECEILSGFYYSTNGTSWTNDTNWLSGTTVEDWQGITISDGQVSQIHLGNNNLSGHPYLSGLTGLTQLSLRGNQITSIESGDFAGLDSLTTLRLSENEITSIPSDAFTGLNSLNTLDLSYNQISSIESGVFDGLDSLTTLDLYNNQITFLESDNFSELTGLIYLNLGGNHISSIENENFAGLSSLTTLGLESNQINSLESGSFVGLDSLTYLGLNYNHITSLENENFLGLDSLTTLSLISNQISSIESDDFAVLDSLTTLRLSENEITSIPSDAFTGLNSLNTLDLSYNQISSIESGVFDGLTVLNTLRLNSNLLTVLPEDTITLTNINPGLGLNLDTNCRDILSMSSELLTFLDTKVGNSTWQTSENPSCPLPPTFCSTVTDVSEAECEILSGFYYSTNGTSWTNDTNWLSGTTVEDWYGVSVNGGNITSINLYNNNLSGHAYIPGLTGLTSLNLSNNSIASIESGDFAGLSGVTYLDLSYNLITSLESGDFVGLSSLTQLNLSYNKITSLESGDFAGLSGVTYLNLNNNGIASIENYDFIGLDSLTNFRLDGNDITSIESGGFVGLDNLTTVNLGSNQISSIESSDFAGLDNLNQLYLYNNQISSIESGDFAGLSALTTLILAENSITSIESGAFAGLTNLDTLSLYSNQITSIESGSFVGLDSLNHLSLYSNLITSIDSNTFTGLDSLNNLYLNSNLICFLSMDTETITFVNEKAGGTTWQSTQDTNSCTLDTDSDTITDYKDNCRFVANTNQADTRPAGDPDGAGDACQPTVSIDSITSNGSGSTLDSETQISDPEDDVLTGNVSIIQDGANVTETWFAGNNLIIGGRSILFDGTYFYDWMFGENAVSVNDCSNPQWTHHVTFDEWGAVFPHTMAVLGSDDQCYDVILDNFMGNVIDATIGGGSTTFVSQEYSGSQLPTDPISLSGLTIGEDYTLYITTNDGISPEVYDQMDFTYQGETELSFGTQAPEAELSNTVNGIGYFSGLVFSKSANVTGVVSGDIINYTFNYENTAMDTLQFGVYIKEYFPIGLTFISSSGTTLSGYVDHEVVYGGEDDVCFQQFLDSTGVYYQLLDDALLGGFHVNTYDAMVGMLGYTGSEADVGQAFYDNVCVGQMHVTNLQDCFNNLDFNEAIQYSYPQLMPIGSDCGVVGDELEQPYYYQYIGYVGTGQSGLVTFSTQFNGNGTGGELITNQAEYYIVNTMSEGDHGTERINVLTGTAITLNTLITPVYDLEVTKTLLTDGPYIPGMEVEYQIDYTNRGNLPLSFTGEERPDANLSLVSFSEHYDTITPNKTYGVEGDICYDNYLNETGVYMAAMDERAIGMRELSAFTGDTAYEFFLYIYDGGYYTGQIIWDKQENTLAEFILDINEEMNPGFIFQEQISQDMDIDITTLDDNCGLETYYTTITPNKTYGVEGDICYDNYLNETGVYMAAMDERALAMNGDDGFTGTTAYEFFIYFYNGGDNEFTTIWDQQESTFAEMLLNLIEEVAPGITFQEFMLEQNGGFGIDITTLDDSCGISGDPAYYTFTGSDLAVGDSNSFIVTMQIADDVEVGDEINNTVTFTYNSTTGQANSSLTIGSSEDDDATPPSAPSGGGGGGAIMVKDVCAQSDCSASYYDRDCGGCPGDAVIEYLTQTGHAAAPIEGMQCNQYSNELNVAYNFALTNTITTIADCEKVNLNGELIRSHMAKMMSNFAINTLGLKPNTGTICEFTDMDNETAEMKFYAKLACQLGLMGLNTDGKVNTVFTPNQVVTRAQFGTVLSRLLRGDKNNGGEVYYQKHLQALKDVEIMTKIDKPFNKELKGRTMLMMQRIMAKSASTINMSAPGRPIWESVVQYFGK